ncbi:MAG TPA: PASTA domain-containing protein, partial [Firmicutes bacterium]|nr:PASTA domain-containing protein [Bacillota bacterium]
ISPEQAKGGHTDARSDIYSAGVVLYEMLTNRLPFEGDSAVSIAIQHISSVPLSPREINPDIPEALELITMKAMAPDMDKRYPSAEAMLHDLDEFRKNPSINFDYVLSDFAVEETSEPTQHLSAADMSEVRHYHTAKSHGRDSRREEYDDRRRDYAEHRKDYDDYDDYDERPVRRGRKNSSRKGVMIGAVIAAVAVIAILFAVIFSGFAGGGQEEYEVPSLLGKTVEEVLADEDFTSRFTLETSGTQFSDEYAQGEIMDQSPEGGRTKKGPKGELHVITVVVSQGPQTDEMPDLLNYNRTSAEGLLKNMDLDLNIVIEEEFSDEIEADHVISTDPVKDTLLKKGDTVTLVMSKGKEIKTVTIINYVGMSLDEARGQLGGLVYGGSTEVEDESAPGTILDQSLSVGDEVEEGTEITFIVSKGIPDQPTEPGSITKTFDLPEGEGTVDVQILVGDQVQFDSTVDKSLGSVTCTLTGTGTQQVYVKFDGIVKYTETVTFS